MFCNQCEQTAKNQGCSAPAGVCGKTEDVQSLQETLLYGLKGMAAYAHHARRLGKVEQKAVAVLLTLLHLGIKGITIGPRPPAFITPTVFGLLKERFDLRLASEDAKSDLAMVL